MSLFKRKPKLHTCFFCKEEFPASSKDEHYQTHLIPVTDWNGHQAYTFDCPRCGLMDMAWGGGTRYPVDKALSSLYVHLHQRHTVLDILSL